MAVHFLDGRGSSCGESEHRHFRTCILLHVAPEGSAAIALRHGGPCTTSHGDCDGKVHGDLPPGRGVVDFVPYLREIAALAIDGAISIELEYSPQPEMIVDWVREAYEKTDELLRQVGLRG